MIKFLTLPEYFSLGPLKITFYSIFILSGAILALLLAMYHVKKLGYKPSRLENLFLVAFPSGIIGARLWYVICTWSENFLPVFKLPANQGGGFWPGLGNIFGITSDGIQLAGLAIQGGVFLGILVGVLFVMKFRKEMKALTIADCAIPGILLAQAIGRLGNFFNQEVYGMPADPSGWEWLGSVFIEQMTIKGEFRLPLFLIEGSINIIGFLVLTFVLGKWLKKYLTPGTVMFSYFIWYGTVRAVLEPLRDPIDIMGDMISVKTSIAFIIIGVVGIALLYAYRYYFKKKFKLHWFDVKVAPNVYIDFASDNYLDQDNNIIEKPEFVANSSTAHSEEKKDKLSLREKIGKKIKLRKKNNDEKQ